MRERRLQRKREGCGDRGKKTQRCHDALPCLSSV
jgi:hypothetical protein